MRRKGLSRLVASAVLKDCKKGVDTPTPKAIIDMVQGRHGVKVSYSTAWRGKLAAGYEVRGTPEQSFMRLPSYLYMLRQHNPGTVTHCECDAEGKFKYVFIALGACIEGFQAMRKVIIVDGTHLSTAYGGVLIFAMAQDPDRHHYPLAFGVVDSETNLSWKWFLEKLKEEVPDDPEIVFVSDRHPSIIKMVAEVYPSANHGYCIQHMGKNVKMRAKYVRGDDVEWRFKECARAYSEAEFIKLYEVFKNSYPTAYQYIESSTKKKIWRWARCYFKGDRYNIDTTNTVESMNNVVKPARSYPILPLFDTIIDKIAEWFNKYRNYIDLGMDPNGMTKLVPRVAFELNSRVPEARTLTVIELNRIDEEYSVTARDGTQYLVNLIQRSCSCKRFDIDKYPCVHAMATVMFRTNVGAPIEFKDLCSRYYWTELWAQAYTETIYPVPSTHLWNVPQHILDNERCLPPLRKSKRGRRKVKRHLGPGEPRRKKSRTSKSCNSTTTTVDGPVNTNPSVNRY